VAKDKRSKFDYILTEKGIDLIPVIMELAIWGTSHFPPGVDPDLITEIEPDREATIKKYKESARSRAKKQRKAR
jgi:DNA-binding HxlR family transcriptional regulator